MNNPSIVTNSCYYLIFFSHMKTFQCSVFVEIKCPIHIDMSDIISKIIPDCSISAVDNLVNNSTTVATNIRRSRRIPKKRTFDDDWIVERSRQNGKKFKTEIDCSVNTTITYSSVNNDQTIPLSVQKCGYSSPKKV